MNNNIICLQDIINVGDVYTGKYMSRTIERDTICDACTGTGFDDKIVRLCKKCQGRKKIIFKSGESKFSTKLCNYCGGFGIDKTYHVCQNCMGTRLSKEQYVINYMIPIGVDNNEVIIVKNSGNISLGNNNRDDIHIKIIIDESNTIFKMEENSKNLRVTLDIHIFDTLVGISKTLSMPNGELESIIVKPIINPKDTIIVKNRGLPFRNNKKQCGDLHISFMIDYMVSHDMSNNDIEHLSKIFKKYKK